jgi:hypothetical protein
MLPDCQQHGERMEALEARRRRFERDAERPVPPLPLFGAGPRARGATNAGRGQRDEGADRVQSSEFIRAYNSKPTKLALVSSNKL